MTTILTIVAAGALLALLLFRLRHGHHGLAAAPRPEARGGALAFPAMFPPPALSDRVSAAYPVVPVEKVWHTVTGLTMSKAEELLDWLEAQGGHETELGELSESGFTVRYK
jgi:hypothetical protein